MEKEHIEASDVYIVTNENISDDKKTKVVPMNDEHVAQVSMRNFIGMDVVHYTLLDNICQPIETLV